MILRAVRLLAAASLVASVVVSACGNSSDSTPTASGGSGGKAGQGGASGATLSGGAAGESAAVPIACGASMCKDDTLSLLGSAPYTIPGCCADATASKCGLDSSFLGMFGPTFDVACQPLAQPGALDKSCPNSPKGNVPNMPGLTITFPGCCRAGGTCGYMLDTIGGLPSLRIGLGCVDSTPFLEGGAPPSCGDMNAGGAGGQGSGTVGAAGEAAAAGAGG